MSAVEANLPKESLIVGDEEEPPSMDIGRRLVEDEKDVYEVEAITGMKELNGRMHYKVRWTGYHAKESTWEPQENLLTCMDMVETYAQSRIAKQKAKQDALEANDKPMPPKDTFWKDFEEGRINVFEQDMYSRVKKSRSQKEKLLDAATTNLGNSSQFKDSDKRKNSINLSKQKNTVLESNLTYSLQRRKTKKHNTLLPKIIIKSSNLKIPKTEDSILLYSRKDNISCPLKSESDNEEISNKCIKRHRNKDRDSVLNTLKKSNSTNNERLLHSVRKVNRMNVSETNWSLNCSVLVENIKYSNVSINLSGDAKMLIQNTEDKYKKAMCDAKSRLHSVDTSVNSQISHQVKENDINSAPLQQK